MQIGDRVTVTRKVYSKYTVPDFTFDERIYDELTKEKKTVRVDIDSVECLFLGYSHLQESISTYEGEYYKEKIKVTNVTKVAVVQQISKNGRYQKPFYTVFE